MPDFIDKDAFLKDVLPECKYPEKLISQVERQPIVHIDDMTFKIQNELQAAKPSRIVEITFVRHGRWIYRSDDAASCYCSECNEEALTAPYERNCIESDFCPNCGAQMDADHIADDSKKVGGADNDSK